LSPLQEFARAKDVPSKRETRREEGVEERSGSRGEDLRGEESIRAALVLLNVVLAEGAQVSAQTSGRDLRQRPPAVAFEQHLSS